MKTTNPANTRTMTRTVKTDQPGAPRTSFFQDGRGAKHLRQRHYRQQDVFRPSGKASTGRCVFGPLFAGGPTQRCPPHISIRQNNIAKRGKYETPSKDTHKISRGPYLFSRDHCCRAFMVPGSFSTDANIQLIHHSMFSAKFFPPRRLPSIRHLL